MRIANILYTIILRGTSSMKKNFKKWLCVVLAVALLASSLPLIAGALAPSGGSTENAPSSGQAPLKVEIRSNKDKYILLGKMEFTATITNTSSSMVENISAQALLESSLRPLANGSQFTATKANLAPNESFSFKYYADLNGLKGLDNLLLPFFWISSLFHGGKADIGNDSGGADFIEASKAVGLVSLFAGQYDASTRVRVWYILGNNGEEEIYHSPIIEENKVMDNGIGYANNELLITAKIGISKKEIETIVKNIGGEIVGYISITNDYQIRFSSSMSKSELEDMISSLSTLPQIDHTSLNYIVDEIPHVYYPNDFWNGASWNENNPSGENWG